VTTDSPIRDPAIIDVEVLSDRSARYGLVIAAPAAGDPASQRRLLDKLEAYIGHCYSPAYSIRYGKPTLETCTITVAIHPDSDPLMFELLERSRSWVEGNCIAFKIRTDVFDITWQ
jgi:hypothetical protein